MSLIFDILKQHEGHDIICLQKNCDYVVICKDCKKDIIVFGEPVHESCFTHECDDASSLCSIASFEEACLNTTCLDDDEYLSFDFDDIGEDDEN